MPSAVALNPLAFEVPVSKHMLRVPSPPLITTVPSFSLTTDIDASALEIASKILHIIDRYRSQRPSEASVKSDEGALKFLALIYGHVKSGVAVHMCLPAFPFKSPNSATKVLGKLPDRAEELALAHLNGLCLAIKDVYPPGAILTIISDGLVYNDLLGVPDKDVWAYGETLRAIAAARGYNSIQFSRLRDLVSINLPEKLDEMTYVANASNFRRSLLNTFSRPDWNWGEVSQSEDVCLTYRGYLKFLQTDLQTVYPVGDDRSKTKFKRGLEYIAKEMISRGDAFANAVRRKYKDHVRLSIHPSTGALKLSISLLPTTTLYTTPWHSTVAYKLDGTTVTGLRSDLEQDSSYELVYENGRPSYYREKSDLLSWGDEKGGITCEPLYPSGWLIKPANGPWTMSMDDIDAGKVRSLSEINSPVVIRGFQIFMGATASPKDTSFTIFSSSNMVFKHLPEWLTLDALRAMAWTVYTKAFDDVVLKELPIVVPHPTTGMPCLRYHEPWPQPKTQFHPIDVSIDGLDEADSASICEAIDAILYDRRVAYFHAWEKGDILISDNTLMMHTRTSFDSDRDRELWRIHLD